MKVCVDRDAVLEILSADASLHYAKALVEKLPTIVISEDDVVEVHAEQAIIGNNIENLTL